jgi:hypothetical protein
LPDANCREWIRVAVAESIGNELKPLQSHMTLLAADVRTLNATLVKLSASATLAGEHHRTLHGEDGRSGLVEEVSSNKGESRVWGIIGTAIGAIVLAILIPLATFALSVRDHVNDKDSHKSQQHQEQARK